MLNTINFIPWNINGASKKDTCHYICDLCRANNVRLLFLFEPMSNASFLDVV